MERRSPDPPAASYLAGLVSSALASIVAIGAAGAGMSLAAPAGHEDGAQLGVGSIAQPAPQSAAPANLVRTALVPSLVRMPGGGEAIAIAVTVAPDWHIYWKNPGDSGAAPTAKIELPAGWTSGALAFPRPEVFGDADERTFGYSGTVHLLIPVTRPEAWQGAVSVKGELSWLACKRSCVAGRSPLAGEVLADAASIVDAPSGRAWPMPLPAGSVAAISGEAAARILSVSVAGVPESEKVQFIPDDCAGIRWGGGTGPFGLQWDAEKRLWTLKMPLSVTPGDAPGHAPRARGLVLVGASASGPAYFVDTPVPAAPTLTSP
jgi:thiol:disulfide interchange protein DsbD